MTMIYLRTENLKSLNNNISNRFPTEKFNKWDNIKINKTKINKLLRAKNK